MYFVGIDQCFELQCRCCINFLGFFLGGGGGGIFSTVLFFPLWENCFCLSLYYRQAWHCTWPVLFTAIHEA